MGVGCSDSTKIIIRKQRNILQFVITKLDEPHLFRANHNVSYS